MKPSETWQLNTVQLGRKVLVFDALHSTNTLALTLAGVPAQDGLVILADEQTAGRGQHGRSWACPRGQGVLMSVLLFPPPPLRRPAVLTAWAAVSVCELIARIAGLRATIKWPNDVLIDGRKVCGILIEQAGGAVAGIGLNLNQPVENFAAPGLTSGASLSMFTGAGYSTRDVARQLIAELDEWYNNLCAGDLTKLEQIWRKRIGLINQEVRVETVHAMHQGRLLELGFDAVMLQQPGGDLLQLPPESVRHLHCHPHALPDPQILPGQRSGGIE